MTPLPQHRHLPSLIGGAVLLGGLAYAHFHVQSQGLDYAGPLLVLDHVFAIAATLLFFLLCAGVGRFVLTRCGFRFESPLEDLLFSIAIGSGLVATSILLCGLFSALNTLVVSCVLLLFALLSWKEVFGIPHLVIAGLSFLKTNIHPLSLFVFGIISLFMITQALTPPFNWDALMYHIRIPTQFLQQGGIYLPDDNLHTAYVQLVHMLYIPLLAFNASSGPILLSVLFSLSLGLAVYSFCLRFFDGLTASLSGALIWGNTMLLLVAITSRVDGTLCYFLFLAQYALVLAWDHMAGTRYFFLAAVLLGLAMGIKYNALIYAAALSPWILWIGLSSQATLLRSIRVLLLFGLLALGMVLPWSLKNLILFQAPLYPVLADRLMEPWLAAVIPDRKDFASVDSNIFRIIAEARGSFNLYDWFTAPSRVSIEGESKYYFPNLVLLLIPGWLLVSRRRLLSCLVVPAVCYGAGVVLYSSRTNLRYFAPVLVPLTVAGCEIMSAFCRRFLAIRTTHLLTVPLFALTLLITGLAMAVYVSRTDVLPYLAGTISRADYLRTKTLVSADYLNVVDFANQHVAKNGRVLMILEARGHYFKVPVIQDNIFTNWPLLASKNPLANCLQSAGFTHVLFSDAAFAKYDQRGLDKELFHWDAFQRFAEQCLIPVYKNDVYTLYDLRDKRSE